MLLFESSIVNSLDDVLGCVGILMIGKLDIVVGGGGGGGLCWVISLVKVVLNGLLVVIGGVLVVDVVVGNIMDCVFEIVLMKVCVVCVLYSGLEWCVNDVGVVDCSIIYGVDNFVVGSSIILVFLGGLMCLVVV